MSPAISESVPKVTIVVPVYNGANFLSQAIDSALAQTYPNIEILVIDDGSDDNGATQTIARSYGDRIRMISKPNGGVASALNTAIDHMTGEFFSWLSHDDLYAQHKVAAQMSEMKRLGNACVILYSNFAVFNDNIDRRAPVSLAAIKPEQFRYWITLQNALHGCTLLIPRAAFDEHGRFDETLRTTQDYDMWFRMARSYKFVHMPEVLVYGRSHPEQGTVKLASVAVRECDNLLAGFVDGLSRSELEVGSRANTTTAYLRLYESFVERGFYGAARHTKRRHLQKDFSLASLKSIGEHLNLIIATVLRLANSGLRKAARRLTTPSFRSRLRELAGKHVRHVSSVADVRNLTLKAKFLEVYNHNLFAGPESRSGAGSNMAQTAIIRREIPRLLCDLGARSMLDAPCGDWYWMREVNLPIERYVGVDIVDRLISKNRTDYGRKGVEFHCRDLSIDALPKTDLILSRDCLVHLSYADSFRVLANFKRSGSSFLLLTTFTSRETNDDLGNGFWRPLNFERAPFNFPPALLVVNEGCTEGDNLYGDKSLALWRLDQLKLPAIG